MKYMESGAAKSTGLINTAGEFERETRSRKFNAIEALEAMLIILVLLWPVSYLLDILWGVRAASQISVALLTAFALFVLFVSPILHRDTLSSWGLGSPWGLARLLRRLPLARRWALIAVLLALFAGLNAACYWRWDEVVKFFHLRGTALAHAKEAGFPGNLAVFGFGSLVAAVILTFGVRYDNFLSALKTAMIVAWPLFAIICVAAYLQRGPDAFAGFSLSTFSLGVFGYLFWGFVQQLLFSAYFGTRFRKAFAPSTRPENKVSGIRRMRVSALFGLVTAAVGAGTLFLGLRALYGAAEAPVATLYYALAFIFPVGALYGYFYCLDRKRLLVATLAASCFGLIHIDSYGLVAGTWLLGIILVYIFMEDKNRNLVALGFIHGLNGSTLGWLFSKGHSGALEIDYSVGPWNVENPTFAVVYFPLVCILAYVATIIWSARRLPGAA